MARVVENNSTLVGNASGKSCSMGTAESGGESARGPGCGCGHHGASPSEGPVEGGGKCNCQRLLWIRKVHSAAGVFFAAFLVEHLAATALGVQPVVFGRYLQFLHAALSAAPWLDGLVFVPLVVAAAFGSYLLIKAGVRYHVKKCNRGGKLRYWLQRLSAIVLAVFLVLHLVSLRDYRRQFSSFVENVPPTQVATSDPQTISTASVLAFQGAWPQGSSFYAVRRAMGACVLLGTWAAVYHLSNGLWSAAIAWGLVATPGSQQRWNGVCLVFGLGLAVVGTIGWWVFI